MQIENAKVVARSRKQGRRVLTMNVDKSDDSIVVADKLIVLKSVWDDEKVVRYHDAEGRPCW